jgi:outer membrane protein assembly factor BamE (lipoprotein component of BamABCDE complex)
MQKLFLVFIVLALVSCSSLDRTERIEEQSLTIGHSSKDDAVAQLGLPKKVKSFDGKEYWYYSDREDFRHIAIPIPIDSNYGNMIDVGPDIQLDFKPALICIFDQQGVLQAIQKPKPEGK